MKKIFCFALLLLTKIVVSQNDNLTVEYSLNFAEDESLSKGNLKDYFEQAKNNAQYLTFYLDCNKNEMGFYSKSAEVDNVNTNFSRAFSGANGYYYSAKNDSLVLNLFKDLSMGKVIVSKNNNFEWKVTSESKKIADFNCYKATTSYSFNNGVGNFKVEIIAWFCPQLPYSYGPKGYGGLPGVILELQERNVVFGATKIIFNKKDFKITKPEGKVITEKEYNEIVKKNIENAKE